MQGPYAVIDSAIRLVVTSLCIIYKYAQRSQCSPVKGLIACLGRKPPFQLNLFLSFFCMCLLFVAVVVVAVTVVMLSNTYFLRVVYRRQGRAIVNFSHSCTCL